MESALIFLTLVGLSQGLPMPRFLSGRIVNGEDAKPGEIPYQVSLQLRDSNFHFCGGSALNNDYVITAAHCVEGQYAHRIQIIAGSVSLDEPKAVHYAVKIIIHESYNSADSWINDIALIKTDVPFIASKSLNFVPLPNPGQVIPADTVAVVSGWGRLWQGGAVPRKLQRAEILIAAQDYCHQIYSVEGYPVYNTHICAHDPDVETGSCNGDSGGPLTVDGTLVGLVSWANGCANIRYPTVYTRVSEYIGWISANAI